MTSQASPRAEWSPNWATHPGEHLAEYLEVRGWSQAEFARIADLSPKLANTIINGKNPVTPETALKLERVLGLKAEVWLQLQANWDLFHARDAEQRRAATPDAKSALAQFPIKELKERGRLPDTRDEHALFAALLAFLGVGSLEAINARYVAMAVQHRQSEAHASSKFHVFSWLLLGEEKGRKMELPAFSHDGFVAAVGQIRSLTVEDPEIFEPRMKALCREAGVALVFEKPISKTCIFGSARWLDSDRAIIQMSLRMKSNDHFWWTFFHEAAHIALHKGQNFVDDESGEGDGAEAQADAWAEDILVGHERFAAFKSRRPRSAAEVTAFAKEVGIHAGIVVGMLQHAHVVAFSHLNGLKVRFRWAN
jgi:HTH-type transcriptional regulator / antitoxin HigA